MGKGEEREEGGGKDWEDKEGEEEEEDVDAGEGGGAGGKKWTENLWGVDSDMMGIPEKKCKEMI